MTISETLRAWSEIFMHHNMREFKQFIDDEELSFSQASALSRLFFGNSCGNSDIAEHLGVTDAAASQVVDRLVQRGLLSRSERPDDRRVRQLEITDAGRRLMEKSVAMRFRWMERLTAELSGEQQNLVDSALMLLIEAVNRLDKAAEAPGRAQARESKL